MKENMAIHLELDTSDIKQALTMYLNNIFYKSKKTVGNLTPADIDMTVNMITEEDRFGGVPSKKFSSITVTVRNDFGTK